MRKTKRTIRSREYLVLKFVIEDTLAGEIDRDHILAHNRCGNLRGRDYEKEKETDKYKKSEKHSLEKGLLGLYGELDAGKLREPAKELIRIELKPRLEETANIFLREKITSEVGSGMSNNRWRTSSERQLGPKQSLSLSMTTRFQNT